MNKCFRKSSGDIIVYLNADDEFAPGAFRKVIDVFSSGLVDMVIGDLMHVLPNQEPKRRVPQTGLLPTLHYWPCLFPLNPVSYFYTRKLQTEIGDFPVTNHYNMDYWFLLHAFKIARLAKIDEVLGTFYAIDNKSSDAERARRTSKMVRNQFLGENPLIAVKYLAYWLFKMRCA